MDVNKDGHIDSKEFLENIRDCGIDVNNQEIGNIFKKLDWNNNGLIDHFEFQRIMWRYVDSSHAKFKQQTVKRVD